MNRRDFMKALVAAGVVPAIVTLPGRALSDGTRLDSSPEFDIEITEIFSLIESRESSTLLINACNGYELNSRLLTDLEGKKSNIVDIKRYLSNDKTSDQLMKAAVADKEFTFKVVTQAEGFYWLAKGQIIQIHNVMEVESLMEQHIKLVLTGTSTFVTTT